MKNNKTTQLPNNKVYFPEIKARNKQGSKCERQIAK
jgi:hypothetical protein